MGNRAMLREKKMKPKFRVWDKKNHIMHPVYGFYQLTLHNDDYHCVCGVEPCGEGSIEIFVTEIMQFTGLKDSKNQEIFEGDIINGKMFPWVVIVVFLKDRALFGWESYRKPGSKGGTFGTFEDLMDTPKYEVIGNIYENPELLEANCSQA